MKKIGSTIPAKSWKVQLISHIKHTCKIIVFFSHVLLWLFSGLEILVQHHSLYNKWGWQRVGGSLIPFHAWILKKYSCVTNTINCVSHVTDLEGKTSNYSSCVQCYIGKSSGFPKMQGNIHRSCLQEASWMLVHKYIKHAHLSVKFTLHTLSLNHTSGTAV